jgi:hypothetical protein
MKQIAVIFGWLKFRNDELALGTGSLDLSSHLWKTNNSKIDQMSVKAEKR